MKRVLLLGGTSFTGFHISEQLSGQFDITSCSRSGGVDELSFDAEQDDVSILDNAASEADVVINCISNGDVDSCESHPEQCKSINLEFVKELVGLQKKHGFHLIHFSTNAIYDGENAPYSENSAVNPINRYGIIKAQADQYIESNSDKYTILRPITMYGVKLDGQRHNPFSFFYQKLQDNEDIVAVDDVYVNMLHVQDLVRCVEVAVDKEIIGTFNISGDDIVNRYEFVSLIKSLVPSSRSEVTRVSSDQFQTVAQRPKNTSFNNSKMKAQLGVFPRPIGEEIQALVELTQGVSRKVA